jgi:hypothetical protein
VTDVRAQKSLASETSFKPKADEQNAARLCRRFRDSRKLFQKWKRATEPSANSML